VTSLQPNDSSASDASNSTALNGDRGFLRSALSLMKPYWIDSPPKEKLIAGALLAGAIGMTVLKVDVLSDFNTWFGGINNTIEQQIEVNNKKKEAVNKPKEMKALKAETDKNLEKFSYQFYHDFMIVLAQYLLYSTSAFVCAQQLSLRWRESMTEATTNKWLDPDNKPYYRLQSVYKNTDNPDQRIAEDIKKFTDSTTMLTTDAVDSVLKLGTFSGILWNLSIPFNLSSLGGPDITIHGLMFWAAAAYSVAGTKVTGKVGKPLSDQNAEQQKREANYRFNLMRTKENSEAVALNDSEETEKNTLHHAFSPVVETTREIISVKKRVIALQSLFGNLAYPVPYLMSSPLIFTGKIGFQGVSQTVDAFGRVSDAMNWFLNTYAERADLKATTLRLSSFNDAIDRSNQDLSDRRALPAPTPMDQP
jgi:putative ATP-binding cassette transporter